jgi:hypothetical protein
MGGCVKGVQWFIWPLVLVAPGEGVPASAGNTTSAGGRWDIFFFPFVGKILQSYFDGAELVKLIY